MITFKTGDIFESDKHYIVIPVNCGGVAGAGLAEQFRIKYPVAAKYYFELCKSAGLRIGEPKGIESGLNDQKSFMLFPTKDVWYHDSKLEWVESSLDGAREYIINRGVKSIAFPAVGCGFGLLNWEDVRPLMIEKLKDLDCDIDIYVAQPERELADKRYLRKTCRVG